MHNELYAACCRRRIEKVDHRQHGSDYKLKVKNPVHSQQSTKRLIRRVSNRTLIRG